jgi:hypothetical protein
MVSTQEKLMNSRILLVTALGLSTATAFAADHSFDRTLTVSSAPTVTVLSGSGAIHLHPGSDSQVHVSAQLRADKNFFVSASDTESRMQQIASNPPIHQAGNTISIGERNNDGLYRNITIEYDITLPRASAISANTGSGEITIQDVGNYVKAGTGSGSVQAHGLHGHVSLETGSGGITLDEAGGGDETRVQTGSGSIHLSGITGALQASTGSGGITAGGTPSADWRLQTGSGSIVLALGSGAHFSLNASTGSGSVHIEQPILMQGSLDRHHVTGTVNGGGPTLRAETGSGGIDIR